MALKGIAGVSEAEWHPQILEQTKRRGYRRFGDVVRIHRHLVVPLAKVNLAEDVAAGCLHRKVLHVGQGVCIRNCHQVEAAEIAARPPGTVALGHHMKGRRPGAVGPPHDSLSLQLEELRLGSL
jgi:hypothetical protein